MTKTKGRGCWFILVILVLLLASVAFAQDKLLTNYTGVNNNVADSTSVDCAKFAANGTTCIQGQYFHSDGATVSPTFNGTATGTSYGAWTSTPSNGASNGCLSCHHGNVAGVGLGGGYLIGGHRNILRKVVPGQPLFASDGNVVSAVVDHGTGAYTINWTTGALTGTNTDAKTGQFASFLIGWIPEPDVYGYGNTSSNLPTYGSCGRCHTTGYRFDNNGPEPTQATMTGANTFTYSKLDNTQFKRTPAGSASSVVSSWYLSAIQCERCHKADMQYDASSVITQYNAGTGSSPNPTSTGGRVSHLTSIYVDPANVGPCTWNATRNRSDCTLIAPVTVGDFTVPAVSAVGGTSSNLRGNGTFTGRPVPKAPSALLCVECHQAYSTWTAVAPNQTVGQTHPTPLPGFESLAPKTDGVNYTSTKEATGQFTATWGCTGATGTVAANDYDGCIAAGGTVNYAPGGMSHGVVTTFLNSPHARVTGYVDVQNPATADPSLTIKGGTLPDGTAVPAGYSTHFASELGVSGSCMGCHNVHGYLEGYVETTATNIEKTMKDCTECHMNGSRYSIGMPAHSQGAGTPFANGTDKSCAVCHMLKSGAQGTYQYHFLRINPDVKYTTFPDARTYYTTYGSGQFAPLKTYDSGETYKDAVTGASKPYPAVALDVDLACGQCHTGGKGDKNPYGITPTGAPVYTREQLANAAANMHSTVPTVAADPTFSMGQATYTNPISVAIYDVTPNAQICYTTDGVTTPAFTDSTPYAENPTLSCNGTSIAAGGSVNITQNTTIKAIAGGVNSIGNLFTPSKVVTATYNIQAPAPTFSLGGGQYNAAQSVTLTASVGSISYCTVAMGGSCTPSTPYAGAIAVSVPTTIKAVAGGAGFVNSSVVQAAYNIVPATPTFAPGTGTYLKGQQVTITGPAGSTIYYTLNGAVPTTTVSATNFTCGVSPCQTSALNASSYVRAIAVYTSGSQTAKSAVATGVYSIK